MLITLASSSSPNSDWAAHEFAGLHLPDKRLAKRLTTLARDFASQPASSIPKSCGSWPKTKAAYRFFDNDSVTPKAILASHVESSVQRLRCHPIVLAVQDTTTMNLSTHPQTEGIGPISNNRSKTLGLFVHSTLAVTPTGAPLGLLHVRTWARTTRTFGRSSNARNRTPLKKKESQKWLDSLAECQRLAALCPETTIVNVADREGDIYELFASALTSSGPRVHLLVRMQHDRQVAHPQKYLSDYVAAQRPSARVKIKVPRKEGRPARLATLTIRHARVTLQAPCLKEHQAPLSLWIVEARELQPPKGVQAICWRLLTTLPVTNASEAVEKVRWYAQRWQIEVLHKVLKSGCQVEQRQLETAERMQRVLMVDLIVAWRVMSLCQAARENPNRPASEWLNQNEWRALACYITEKSTPPKRPPSLGQAVKWIATLGGFLGRRHDGEPGPMVLWRGLTQLHAITAAWRRFGLETCG